MQAFLSQSPPNPYSQWVLVGMTVATLLYMAIIRPAMKKKKDPLAKQPSFSSLSQQRNVERQMQSLLVELSEMARQITAQLDTRSQKLEMLIQDADQRIAALKQFEKQPPDRPAVIAYSPAMTRNISIPEPAADVPVEQHQIEQHQTVYALADQGRSASDIARELDRPRGEVELILALRPKQRA
jgi:hypothetical protein